ncbi:MAG: glycine cleavage system protein GcvH [Deltaproteobacteria bacterium]|jgi:glycine cleavage system H protein|nr:glycine cleavage system protein GcvH [Deltaproteobacteria bacterium]MBT6433240.1 glycine cleavage system protein GcvH [Deltaproteobacteria bacterium]
MSVPEGLLYTKEHEWIRQEGDVVVVGITHHAQDQLGDVVYVELPEVGVSIEEGDTFGTVESVKAVSDLYAPVTGEVVAINEVLEDAPESVNTDAYGDGWMIKVKVSGETEGLMSPADYQALLG